MLKAVEMDEHYVKKKNKNPANNVNKGLIMNHQDHQVKPNSKATNANNSNSANDQSIGLFHPDILTRFNEVNLISTIVDDIFI